MDRPGLDPAVEEEKEKYKGRHRKPFWTKPATKMGWADEIIRDTFFIVLLTVILLLTIGAIN